MSQSQAPPPPAPDETTTSPTTPVANYRGPDLPAESSSAEAWISIGIGVILMFCFPNFLQWLISLISSYKPPFLPITDVSTGAEVPYPKSIFFLGNLCTFAFALTLICDGVLLFFRRPLPTMLALGLTAAATALNMVYLVRSFLNNEGFPIVSALAVVFGIYIANYQWKLLATLRRRA
jgi:hypothetical protein